MLMTSITTHLNTPKYPEAYPKNRQGKSTVWPYDPVSHSCHSIFPHSYKSYCRLLPRYAKNIKPGFLFPS